MITQDKNSGMFPKGKSGNPGGRQKKTEEQRQLEELCKAKTKDALSTILAIMQSGENERNRLAAAQYVIDRGWGKARQEVEHSGKDGQPIKMNMVVEFVRPQKSVSGKA